MKLHEKNPDAPLSPFFLNLRSGDNPKPGPLASVDFDLIARALWEKTTEEGLSFQAIVGIPNAGDPIIEAIERLVPKGIALNM